MEEQEEPEVLGVPVRLGGYWKQVELVVVVAMFVKEVAVAEVVEI